MPTIRNGTVDMVVMSIAEYERQQALIELYNIQDGNAERTTVFIYSDKVKQGDTAVSMFSFIILRLSQVAIRWKICNNFVQSSKSMVLI